MWVTGALRIVDAIVILLIPPGFQQSFKTFSPAISLLRKNLLISIRLSSSLFRKEDGKSAIDRRPDKARQESAAGAFRVIDKF